MRTSAARKPKNLVQEPKASPEAKGNPRLHKDHARRGLKATQPHPHAWRVRVLLGYTPNNKLYPYQLLKSLLSFDRSRRDGLLGGDRGVLHF